MSEPRVMTVRELVAELAMGPVESFDLSVELEGCDCWGELSRVVYEDGHVLLTRVDSYDYGDDDPNDEPGARAEGESL